MPDGFGDSCIGSETSTLDRRRGGTGCCSRTGSIFAFTRAPEAGVGTPEAKEDAIADTGPGVAAVGWPAGGVVVTATVTFTGGGGGGTGAGDGEATTTSVVLCDGV